MTKQRVILANSSRLLREMLNRIFRKSEKLEVVLEITDHHTLSSAIEELDAGWVIMSPMQDQKMPTWVDTYVEEHPKVRFMTVSNDGSIIHTKWMDKREENIKDLTLNDLIQLLEHNYGQI